MTRASVKHGILGGSGGMPPPPPPRKFLNFIFSEVDSEAILESHLWS